MAIRSYRQLEVWQRAIELAEAVYSLTVQLPESERFGLRSQLQRSAVSVAANIAEGYGRLHRGDYLRHLSIARGSVAEIETHLTLTVRLKLLSRAPVMECWKIAQQVGQMLTKLIRSLQPDSRNPTPETRRSP